MAMFNQLCLCYKASIKTQKGQGLESFGVVGHVGLGKGGVPGERGHRSSAPFPPALPYGLDPFVINS